ncbi:MAG TPA: FtsX-like permease family protein [Chitinophagaceae bacterium]|nr:FtsX-like permease family protein [Chitinophagaceae bacterium]
MPETQNADKFYFPKDRGWDLKKLLRLSYRNLFRNKRRSFFAILIAAAGCTALSIAVGYYSFSIYSLQELTIRNGFGGSNGSGHVQLMDKHKLDEPEEHAMQFGIDSMKKVISLIKTDDDVDYVLPRVEFSGLISNGDRSLPFKGYGVDAKKEMILWKGLTEINSRLLLHEQLLPLTQGKPGIILGSTLANSLHAKAGDVLMMYTTTVDGTMNGTDVELLGVMSTGVSETDKYYLLTNIEMTQQLMNTGKVSLLSVMFKNRKRFDEKLQNLKTLLKNNSLTSGLATVSWNERAAFYVSIRDIFNIIFSFMGTIILVIVLLSCWNIMNMATMERIREIGTLRAIGLNIKNINAIFLLEAFLIGVTGSVIGMILQWIISRVINSLRILMPPVPGMSRPYTLQVYAGTWLHPVIALGIIAAITISGISSLIIIKRYTIVESLEHT